MIRLLLVDDHVLVRTGLRMVIAEQPDLECVGEAGSGEEGLALVRRTQPDIVLFDLHMPGLGGLEFAERMLRLQPAPRIIAVSMQHDGPLPRRVLQAGAHGYVTKGSPAEELLRAIRDVAKGKRYIGSDVAQLLALGSVGTDSASPFDELTTREIEVAMLLAQGLRPGDIAGKLNLSPKTVSTHKARLLDKLGVGDTVTLARMVSQYGLAEPTGQTSS